MSQPPVIKVVGITKRFYGFVALDSVDFELRPGERVGLIGPNGSGKSTFVNCISGTLPTDGGSILFDGKDITRMAPWRRARLGMSRSFQIPRPFRGMTVRENIELPLQFTVGEHDRARVEAEAEAILGQVGLSARSSASPRTLSQGELRKLELGRALAGKPRVLMADEAMAGLSDSEVDEIIELLMRLNRAGIAVIMIEHIMRAVVRFSERIMVLVAGEKIADGKPEEVMAHPEVVRAYLGQ
jgi:branched-chain amino acid transport system ATP-binding protein